MSNAQGNILLTARFTCGNFTSALGGTNDVGDWNACNAAGRDLGRGVVVIWKVQSGDVHILRRRIDTATIELCKDISNTEGFLGSTHIARLRREAPIDVWDVQSKSGVSILLLTPQVSRWCLVVV